MIEKDRKDLLDGFGKSDLEATDKYNELNGTRLSSPLSIENLYQLRRQLNTAREVL